MSSSPPSTSERLDSERLGPALPTILGVRLVGNTIIRFPYVFVTAISTGLGIPIATTTALLGARELAGIASLGIGRWADHGHERRAQAACAAGAGSCVLAAGFAPSTALFSIALIAGGIGLFGAAAAQSSWVSHRVAFERRARIIGITELTWGGAFLLGAPLSAWLVQVGGWRLPFRVFGALLVVGAAITWVVLPTDSPSDGDAEAPAKWAEFLGAARRSWGIVAYNALQPFAQMLIFAVAGDWFVQKLGMSLTGLGANTLLVGAGELVGTAGTVAFADRIGPRRAGIAGMMLVAPAAACMGLVGSNAAIGVALLVVIALGMEFSFVSAFPLATELLPTSRGAMIGATLALMTLARAVSASVAGWLYETAGIAATGLVAATLATLAGAALWTSGRSDQSSENANLDVTNRASTVSTSTITMSVSAAPQASPSAPGVETLE